LKIFENRKSIDGVEDNFKLKEIAMMLFGVNLFKSNRVDEIRNWAYKEIEKVNFNLINPIHLPFGVQALSVNDLDVPKELRLAFCRKFREFQLNPSFLEKEIRKLICEKFGAVEASNWVYFRGFEMDIYVPHLGGVNGLNVEIDGFSHVASQGKNMVRDRLFERNGIKVVCVSAFGIGGNLEAVKKRVLAVIR